MNILLATVFVVLNDWIVNDLVFVRGLLKRFAVSHNRSNWSLEKLEDHGILLTMFLSSFNVPGSLNYPLKRGIKQCKSTRISWKYFPYNDGIVWAVNIRPLFNVIQFYTPVDLESGTSRAKEIVLPKIFFGGKAVGDLHVFMDRIRIRVFYYIFLLVVWAAVGIFLVLRSLFKSSARVKVLKTDNKVGQNLDGDFLTTIYHAIYHHLSESSGNKLDLPPNPVTVTDEGLKFTRIPY